MTALLLTCLLGGMPAAEDDALLKQLDADFEELVRLERNPQPLRDAARLLQQTNNSDRWTYYLNALALLRQHRSRAAIPLLLKYMHSFTAGDYRTTEELANTLELLTGEDVASSLRAEKTEAGARRRAVLRLVETWWQPNKEKITTDPGKMSREQLQLLTDRLLRTAAKDLRDPASGSRPGAVAGGPTAALISRMLTAVLRPDRQNRPLWWEEELHPALLPPLLAAAGYVDPNPGPLYPPLPGRETTPIPFMAIPMLAALRNNGEAPALDKVAADRRQNSATRLTCLLALYRAGEDLRTEALLPLLESEKNLERRLTIVLALGYARDANAGVPKLLELMDDPNEQVRAAAVLALGATAPKEAVPRFKKVLDEASPSDSVFVALRALGQVRTPESAAVLAGFLEAALEDGKKGRFLLQALHAFQDNVGERWTEAGAHPEGYYRDKARTALAWWKERNK